MKKRIKTSFDRSTRTYRASALVQKRIALECCQRIPVKPFSRILEIGAGGGLLTQACFERLPGPHTYAALDISGAMLSLIRDRQARKIQGDGEAPPFRKETFDLLISSSAMQWYADPPASMARNLHLLKKTGFFSLALFVRGTFKEMEEVGALTGFGNLYPLPEAQNCICSLSGLNLDLKTCTREYTEYFPDVPEFLKSHKQTGATYTGSRASTGKKAYHDFCRTYQELFLEKKGIRVSYNILYLWGNKT
ncbi:methyltransferase domain-containing protein [Desulfonatronovibrio hydrogenovorans]|uniref:methyltransferase domain-containing protein n=1 Tax=Desulfonatronovibrio hydrogenovorans TaxID=53245 RepID=UPI0004905F16|nr:methyltransferase domain-containing protein [Desulfonatronovibrio hydrogenovorans]